MSGTLKIDGYDLWPALKLNQEEGLDPAFSEFLTPQFGDAAAGDGDPLLSVHAGNRTLTFPLVINPAKLAGGYANTVDGLNDLVRDLNRKCLSALLIEWAGEGAVNSTFFDVVHAKLNIKFNYRRQAVKWTDADLVCVVKPYGTTGTSILVGTAVASAPISFYPTAPDGDADALISIVLNTASNLFAALTNESSQQAYGINGYCVTTPSNNVFWSGASYSPDNNSWNSPTVIGASGAVGSQVMRSWQNSGGYYGPFPNLPPGRHRVIGFVRTYSPNAVATVRVYSDFGTEGSATNVFGGGSIAQPGMFHMCDLGTLHKDPLPVGTNTQIRISFGLATTYPASFAFEVGGLLLLPEESTTLLNIPNQSWSGASRVLNGVAEESYALAPHPSLPSRYLYAREELYLRGDYVGLPTGTAAQVVVFSLGDGAYMNRFINAEIRMRERFTFTR